MDDIILTHSLTTKGNNSNILVVGSCRTGKTNFFVRPNLFHIKDSVTVIARNDDNIDDTIKYRQNELKQLIFDKTIPDIENSKRHRWTAYLIGSCHDERERNLIVKHAETILTGYLEKNDKNNYVTVIIDDLTDFTFDKYFLLDMLEQGKSRGIRVVATLQNINRLKQTYSEEHTEKILNQFGIKMFFQNNDPDDAEYIEQRYIYPITCADILNLGRDKCVITGLKDKPVLYKDKIQHWFSYGKIGEV